MEEDRRELLKLIAEDKLILLRRPDAAGLGKKDSTVALSHLEALTKTTVWLS